MSEVKDQRRQIKAQVNSLRHPNTPADAQERAKLSEMLRECESNMLIERATRWGIEVCDKPEWYSQTNKTGTVKILLPYLNQAGTAVLTHQIRMAKFAYWKVGSEILIPILSLTVAILALLRK